MVSEDQLRGRVAVRRPLAIALLALGMAAGLFAASPSHPASANNWGTVHCVHFGETLSGIAARYGTTVWAIAQANGLPNPNAVPAGICLTIPGGYHGGYAPPGPGHQPLPTSDYCVRPGDTLSGIGRHYGVSAWSIAYANGLPNPNCIRVGQHLRIPGR